MMRKKNIKIPAHKVNLTRLSNSTPSTATSTQLEDITKVLSDYKRWRENTTIVTGTLLRHALQDLMSVTAKWSQHPKLNLGLNLDFLKDEGEDEEEEEGDEMYPNFDQDNDEDDDEDENFGDVDYMSKEPPITVSVAPVAKPAVKRKEPEGGPSQPPPKKPRQ